MSMQGMASPYPQNPEIPEDWTQLKDFPKPVDETSVNSIIFMQHGALGSLNKAISVLQDRLSLILIDEEALHPPDSHKSPNFRCELGRMATITYDQIQEAERRIYRLVQKVNV